MTRIRHVATILACTAAAETACTVAWFLWADHRISQRCELIDEACAGRPGQTFDELLMQLHAARTGRTR